MELDAHFNILVAHAEHHQQDEVAQVIRNAQGLVGRVYDAAGASFALLVAARVFSEELIDQRDELTDELDEIKTGLDDPDYATHDLVVAALEKIKEVEGESAMHEMQDQFEQWKLDAFDEMVEEAHDYAEEMIYDRIDEEVAAALDMSEFEARDVLELIRGDVGAITEEEAEELRAWELRVRERIRRDRGLYPHARTAAQTRQSA